MRNIQELRTHPDNIHRNHSVAQQQRSIRETNKKSITALFRHFRFLLTMTLYSARLKLHCLRLWSIVLRNRKVRKTEYVSAELSKTVYRFVQQQTFKVELFSCFRVFRCDRLSSKPISQWTPWRVRCDELPKLTQVAEKTGCASKTQFSTWKSKTAPAI